MDIHCLDLTLHLGQHAVQIAQCVNGRWLEPVKVIVQVEKEMCLHRGQPVIAVGDQRAQDLGPGDVSPVDVRPARLPGAILGIICSILDVQMRDQALDPWVIVWPRNVPIVPRVGHVPAAGQRGAVYCVDDRPYFRAGTAKGPALGFQGKSDTLTGGYYRWLLMSLQIL